jgi:hypothetical protein
MITGTAERRRQAETLADPDGQHPAVDEDGSARIRSDFEHRLDDRIVQAIAVHRRKERNDSQMPALEKRDEARASIAGGRIEHEEADEACRMADHRRPDRSLVARHAGDEGDPRDRVSVQLGHPAVGQLLGRARWIPSELRRDGDGPIAGDLRSLSQQLEKPAGEEMTVRIADHRRTEL